MSSNQFFSNNLMLFHMLFSGHHHGITAVSGGWILTIINWI